LKSDDTGKVSATEAGRNQAQHLEDNGPSDLDILEKLPPD
jgi:hypothetical protein